MDLKFKDINLLDVGNKLEMAGVIYTSEDRILVCLFPGEDELAEAPVENLEMNLDEWQCFLNQTDNLLTEVNTKAADGSIVKAMARKCQRQIDTRVQWKVFKRDGYCCCYCGNDDTPLTVDHLVVWEDGGPSIEANLLTACKKCNKARGNMPYGEWITSSYYMSLNNLSAERHFQNTCLEATLGDIKRVYVRSR